MMSSSGKEGDHMGAVVTESPPLGNAVRRFRVERDWTVNQLAARAGVARRVIVDIERGDHNPTAAVMLRLAAAFEVEMGDLFWSAA
jgi:DNA-binding XRE family transcriptional regulator